MHRVSKIGAGVRKWRTKLPQPQRLTLNLAQSLLGADRSKLDPEQVRVLEHIDARHPISEDASDRAALADTRGSRLADAVARIGGSWGFIGAFFLFLASWVVGNSWVLVKPDEFDPYPFVFLNLVLSMLAAVQAPIIMMSQNRQAEKDRVAASHDYEVNLRSEFEILAMQQKLDHLRGEQHGLLLAKQEEMLTLLRKIVEKAR